MIYFVLYVMVILDGVRDSLSAINFLSFMGALFLVVGTVIAFLISKSDYGTVYSSSTEEEKTENKAGWAAISKVLGKWAKVVVVLCLVANVGRAMMPTTEQAAFVVGGAQVYNVLTSDKAVALSNEAYTIVQGLMKNYAEKFEPTTKKAVATP